MVKRLKYHCLFRLNLFFNPLFHSLSHFLQKKAWLKKRKLLTEFGISCWVFSISFKVFDIIVKITKPTFLYHRFPNSNTRFLLPLSLLFIFFILWSATSAHNRILFHHHLAALLTIMHLRAIILQWWHHGRIHIIIVFDSVTLGLICYLPLLVLVPQWSQLLCCLIRWRSSDQLLLLRILLLLASRRTWLLKSISL